MRGLACGPEINKWDLFKLISICTAKEIINKTKQSMNWENIFANNATNKGLIKKNKTKQNRFFKEDTQMANRYVQRCSASLIIRETQIKTTKRYYLTLVRMTIIKKLTKNKCWRGCQEKGTLLYC